MRDVRVRNTHILFLRNQCNMKETVWDSISITFVAIRIVPQCRI